MSLEQLIHEAKHWQIWRLQGSRGNAFWETRRSLIAEVYGQLQDLQITKYEALYVYNYLRMG